MKTRICPNCGSNEIELEAGGISGIYKCNRCKFRGALFPELVKEISKSKKEREIKFCPKCKSENVELTTTFFIGGRYPAIHTGMNKCKDCGYEGTIFPIKIKLKK